MAVATIVKKSELKRLAERAREMGLPIFYTTGGFDGLHAGHWQWLSDCRERAAGGILVIVVCNDELLRKLKGEGRPLVPELERTSAVALTDLGDYVVLDTDKGFRGALHMGVLEQLRPDYWIMPELGLVSLAVKKLAAQRLGIRVIVQERTPPPGGPISTTMIAEDLRRARLALKPQSRQRTRGSLVSTGDPQINLIQIIIICLTQSKNTTHF